jgi:hypothetical protein
MRRVFATELESAQDKIEKVEKVRRAPAFQSIWAPAEYDELRRVRDENPFVFYPVLLLDSDRQLDSLAGLIHPPRHGVQLRLSGYLHHLRRFLILQLTAGHEAAGRLVIRAVREFAKTASQEELLEFLDLIWRGRWIVGSFEWGRLRLDVLAGDADGLAALIADHDRLETAAVAIVQTERKLKDSAASIEEWLHEIFCLLPTVHAMLFALHKANKARYSDELEKFDRVLDEFQADIMTTLGIAFEEGKILDYYIIKPLLEEPNVDAALKQIRGLYRGRTIIPRVWYQFVERTAKAGGRGPSSPVVCSSELLNVVSCGLAQPDPCAAFGRAICMRTDPWMELLHVRWSAE